MNDGTKAEDGMIGDETANTQGTDAEAEEYDWDDDVATLGDRLSRAREATGMTQAQLARRLGVKLSTVRNWEADRSEPRANRLQMLSGLLNVSFVWLMTGEGETNAAITDELPEGANDLLREMAELRVMQRQLAERTGQIEKRLRAMLARL